MALKVVGAGVGRTGTFSLKTGLEKLLGEPCHHMFEVVHHLETVKDWHRAAHGEKVDWNAMMAGYAAAVDWPACAYWKQLSALNPDAIVVLSHRDPQKWWESASETIFPSIRRTMEDPQWLLWQEMVMEMLRTTFTDDLTNREACIAAFERHNDEVRQTIPANRLVVWQASDGWGPLCEALKLPIPDEPFPRTNSKEEFLAR